MRQESDTVCIVSLPRKHVRLNVEVEIYRYVQTLQRICQLSELEKSMFVVVNVKIALEFSLGILPNALILSDEQLIFFNKITVLGKSRPEMLKLETIITQ